MANVQDVQTKVDELKGKVEAQTTVVQSAVTLIQGFPPLIADLKKQLVDAIAAGADPTALQAVVDGMTAAETTVDANAQALADAVSANTPPTPPTP
jgi:hypothetical protein